MYRFRFPQENRGWDEVKVQDIGNGRDVIHEYDFSTDQNQHGGYEEYDVVPEDLVTPVWQFGPGVIDSELVGLDLFTHPVIHRIIQDIRLVRHDILSELVNLQFLLGYTNYTKNIEYHPRSIIAEPIFEDFTPGAKVVGVM